MSAPGDLYASLRRRYQRFVDERSYHAPPALLVTPLYMRDPQDPVVVAVEAARRCQCGYGRYYPERCKCEWHRVGRGE